MAYENVINYIESQRIDFADKLTEELSRADAPRSKLREIDLDEEIRGIMKEEIRSINPSKYDENKFEIVADTLDVTDYSRLTVIRLQVGRTLAFRETLEIRRRELEAVTDREQLMGFGLSPTRATFKTLITRFDVDEAFARERAEELGLREAEE